jgi:hypothetical protein
MTSAVRYAVPFGLYTMVSPAMIFVTFGNTFCPFLYRSEIVAAHKIMDIRPLAALELPGISSLPT